MTENKYHFGREIIYNLRSCHAISNEVYLHWLDKLNKEEKLSLCGVVHTLLDCFEAKNIVIYQDQEYYLTKLEIMQNGDEYCDLIHVNSGITISNLKGSEVTIL